MENMDGFISASPEKMLPLLTTHSPDFLGLHQEMGFWKESNFGKGVIIGVLDSGVLPSHPSFSGEGIPPPPAKWKGSCEFMASECNNKLIGARSFNLGWHLTLTWQYTRCDPAVPFFQDNIAVGSFAAMQKGIFVSCSAGNSGPFNTTLSNEAPWILTVGASSIDRTIKAAAKLGNGEQFDGETLFQPSDFPATQLPLVYAGMNGKPESAVSYINSTATPTAAILFKGTVIGNPLSPAITSFSSRGPSFASPGILKPDIIGPGVSILAAWPFPLDNNINSKSTFNIISGTSILLPADIFATGAGHVNPSRANDPGLVYDIEPDDYIPYLCGLGYTDTEVGILAHRSIKCSEESSIPEGELNYPSFSVALGPPQTFTRTVTNVGEAYSSYTVTAIVPQGVDVSVNPDKLYFSKVNQKLTYSVTFSHNSSSGKSSKFAQGYLKWVSGKHSVGSPISIMFK
ncbi:unnamed protein product, partial [Vitis vinifera]